MLGVDKVLREAVVVVITAVNLEKMEKKKVIKMLLSTQQS